MLKFKIFSKEFLDGLSLMVLREIGREIGVKSATSKQIFRKRRKRYRQRLLC